MADGASKVVETLPKTSDLKAKRESHEASTKPEEPEGSLEVIDSSARRRMASESSVTEDASYAELQETCRETFRKIAEYLNGELTASLDDYTLLEKLNKLTTSKYQEMSTTAKMLITSMEELDGKYKSLQPYLDQIDSVEESVASLEQAAYRLDAYSKKLAQLIHRVSCISPGLMINVDRPKPEPTMTLIGNRRKRYFQKLFDLKEKRLKDVYDLMLRKEQVDFESKRNFCEDVLPFCQTRKRYLEKKILKE